MTDDALQQLVSEELFWDPKVDSGAIAATAADGVVTLRGTVGSFREKREARNAAELLIDCEEDRTLPAGARRDAAGVRSPAEELKPWSYPL